MPVACRPFIIFVHLGYYIVQFQLYAQEELTGWFDDNTAVNNNRVRCRGPGIDGTSLTVVTGVGADFDRTDWTSWSATCDAGWATCRVRIRASDSSGVTDMQMTCCQL